jgi:hypothetical protein
MDLPYLVTLWVVAVVAVPAAAALGVALSRSRADRRRLAEELAAVRADRAAPPSHPGPAVPPGPSQPSQFVITTMSQDDADLAPEQHPVAGRSFASVAAGESLVRAASLVHGVRRALSAESRHRIRFEMAREVKRSRKQRRRDLRAARRESRPAPARSQVLEEDAA